MISRPWPLFRYCPGVTAFCGSSEIGQGSDDKGPEPEGVAVGEVDGVTYAFIGLERIGGIMAYDVSDPARPRFAGYVNTRNFKVEPEAGKAAGDVGPEGMAFIPAASSPNGEPLLAVGFEVSGSTTIYSLKPKK